MRKKPSRTWKHTRFRQYELPGILILVFLSLLVMLFRFHRQKQYVSLSAAEVFSPEMKSWYTDSSNADSAILKVRDKAEEWMSMLVEKTKQTAGKETETIEKPAPAPAFEISDNLRSAPIDINTSDSVGFLPLHGIGPVYSGRIVKYRNLLGGFYSLVQLSEVYGLDTSVVRRNMDRLKLDTLAIQTINLNTAKWVDLVRHPYIDKNQANDILALRKHLGGEIVSTRQLLQNRIFTQEEYSRLRFYLTVGEKGLAKTP